MKEGSTVYCETCETGYKTSIDNTTCNALLIGCTIMVEGTTDKCETFSDEYTLTSY